MLGKKKHVVSRCDEEQRHSWDIWHKGEVVSQGFKTRKEAQEEADYLNLDLNLVFVDPAELDQIADPNDFGTDMRCAKTSWASVMEEE